MENLIYYPFQVVEVANRLNFIQTKKKKSKPNQQSYGKPGAGGGGNPAPFESVGIPPD